VKTTKVSNYLLLLLTAFICIACSTGKANHNQEGINYLTDIVPRHPDGDINVVIEVPAGTLEKWEVSKPEGVIRLEQIEGKPRKVKYLAYPGNYGMIPQTLLPKSAGGDGDPLDVIVLGPSVKRGSIIKAKIIGMLHLLDRGEQDDKLIAVQIDSPLYQVESIEQLIENYQGIATIIETWFTNYKGPGQLESKGFSEADTANETLKKAIAAFNISKETN